MLDRRNLLASLALTGLARPSLAGESVAYRGFALDLTQEPARNGYAIVELLHSQIDIIVDSGVKPQILDFFRAIPIALRGALENGYRIGPQIGLELAPVVLPATAPIVLRALLVPYFNRALPAPDQASLTPFYDEARQIARAQVAFAYLAAGPLQQPVLFFAQTASLYLCGTAESPPFERKILQQDQPAYCDWLAAILGVRK